MDFDCARGLAAHPGRVKGFASRGWGGKKKWMFYVYVLRSESDFGFYIGFSTDLKRRLSEHTRGTSFATKSRGPWKLIYYEAYTEREDAEGREKFSKERGRTAFPACPITPLSQTIPRAYRVKGFASRGRLVGRRDILPICFPREPREARPFTRHQH